MSCHTQQRCCEKKTCLDLFFFLAGLSRAVSLYFCHDKTFRTVTLLQIAAQTCNFFLWLVSRVVASAPNGLLVPRPQIDHHPFARNVFLGWVFSITVLKVVKCRNTEDYLHHLVGGLFEELFKFLL